MALPGLRSQALNVKERRGELAFYPKQLLTSLPPISMAAPEENTAGNASALILSPMSTLAKGLMFSNDTRVV